jgi:hypothetical protein
VYSNNHNQLPRNDVASNASSTLETLFEVSEKNIHSIALSRDLSIEKDDIPNVYKYDLWIQFPSKYVLPQPLKSAKKSIKTHLYIAQKNRIATFRRPAYMGRML